MYELTSILEHFDTFLYGDSAKEIFSQQQFQNKNDLEAYINTAKEIQEYQKEFYSYHFREIPDMRAKIKSTEKGYVLDRLDIFHIYNNLQQWQEICQIEIEKNRFSELYNLVNEIFMPKDLGNLWNRAFDEEGNILDSASPELQKIRTMKKSLRLQIEKILQKQVQNNSDLAEKRLAFREDRYVLPIKSSAKKRISGIVHGFSSTGQVTYIEPQEIVSLNNELLSVDDLEHQEINRLLRSWSMRISEYTIDLIALIERSAFLEILFASARFAEKYQAIFPEISTNHTIYLEYTYNPFLLIKKGKQETIPITISLEDQQGMIISGPNAGGKSACLKTLGLCCSLFLKGIPVPAQEARLPFYEKILMEIGDSQSLENDLSTFSGHLINIKKILQDCSDKDLVLIDEIAHATDPVEGEALGCAVIDALLRKNTTFAITTHYKKIKLKAFEDQKIKIYATGFNIQTMSPEFKLYENHIGESYALKMAFRVGLDKEIIKSAENNLIKEYTKSDQLLKNIELAEKKLREKEQELARKEQELAEQYQELLSSQQELDEEREKVRKEGLSKVDKELSYCLKELSSVQKKLAKEPKQSQTVLKEITELVVQKKSEITKLSRPLKTSYKEGDWVFVASLNKKGVIENISKNHTKVRIGTLVMNIAFSDLFELNDQEKQQTQTKKNTTSKNISLTSSQIDLHGYTVEEAIYELENVLHKAYAQGYHEFFIIHGKGSGALKKHIHNYLKKQAEFSNFHLAPSHLGGSGTTIVSFKN